MILFETKINFNINKLLINQTFICLFQFIQSLVQITTQTLNQWFSIIFVVPISKN
jgi:hypothetical protein